MTRGQRLKNELADRHNAAHPGQIADDAVAFQPDSVEVDLRKLPKAAYVLLWTSTALILLALLWSIWAKIDRTVTTTGRIVSQSRTIVQQPFQASIIRNLNFRAGDRVMAGQVIATLDQTVTSVDLEQLQAQIEMRQAELSRIEAELNDTAMADDQAGSVYEMQRALLAQRREEFNTTLSRYAARHELLLTQQRIAATQETQITAQLDLAIERFRTAEQLASTGARSHLDLMAASSEVTRLEAAKQEKIEEQRRFTAEMDVLRRELASFRVSFRQPLYDRRIVLQNEIAQLGIQIARAQRISDLLSFRAPVDGVLMDVTTKSIGSVVEPAEVLFTLVPLGNGLDLEFEVSARDAGWIRIGQEVRIKLDPFPFQRHGTLNGEITAISPDAFQRSVAGRTQVYFRVRVAITQNNLRNVPEGFELMPGITAIGEILIGPRTVISYVTDPIHRALDEGLREPN